MVEGQAKGDKLQKVLANAGLGAVHGIAGPLGGMHNAPHGAVCARLLPIVTAANIKALQNHDTKSLYLARYAEIARILTGDSYASVQNAILWLQSTADRLEIPSLSQWGLQHEQVPSLARQALKSSSMRGNPVALNAEAIEIIIYQALEAQY